MFSAMTRRPRYDPWPRQQDVPEVGPAGPVASVPEPKVVIRIHLAWF